MNLLIKNGYFLDVDAKLSIDRNSTDFQVRDVLIAEGRIAEIGESLDAPQDAEVIDARGKIVMPGLVDTHLHMWQTPLRGMTHDLWAREYFHTVHPMSQHYTPEDMYWATYGGAVELLSHGVTQVFDYCHSANSPEHVDASLQGLKDSGIRATFGFGLFERETQTYRDRNHRLEDLARIVEKTKSWDNVDVALALDHKYDANAVATARELGVMISVHGNPVGLAQEFIDDSALGRDVLWTHGNFTTERELQGMAQTGTWLALTPDIEMGMGKPVDIFDRAVRAGIDITLGVDVTSYAAGDLLTQMHMAYALHRVLDGARERGRGHIPPLRDIDIPQVSTRDIVRMATVNGARSMGRSEAQDGLVAGAPADVILVDTEPFGIAMGDPAGHIVQQTTSRDIAVTIVGGQVKYRDRELLGVDTAEVSAQLKAARDRLLERKEKAGT